jgi:predicted alpha/beta superfamily hydrolase
MFEFVVRVPNITPPWQPVFLAGDGPQLGDWSADRVRLDCWDDGTRYARLDLPAGFRGRFLVTLGRWRTAETDGRGGELPPREVRVERPGYVEVNVAGWGRNSVEYHHDFTSRFVPHPRTISVWLPPGYHLEPRRRYPVFYMHDGQNLFDPETAFAGNPWWADEVTERGIRDSRVAPVIIVGVANSVDRLREYGPRRCGRDRAADWSRDYARFVVEEVKPFVDGAYRTLPDAEHTGIGGSSMGGLISLHMAKWYPTIIGRCAAMSPSIWWDQEYFLQNVHVSPAWMKTCRVWLDMGTREGSSEAGAAAMVGRARRLAHHFARRGMRDSEGFHYEEVEGGMHNEAAWGGRLERVLQFLFPATTH